MTHRNDANADRPVKIARIRRILADRGAPALHLASPAALAWLFDGARTGVPLGGAPVFSATVDADGGVRVTTLANEADRLAEEEICGTVEWDVVPWHAALDTAVPGALREGDAMAELRAARAVLTPAERDRYRALGTDTARAVTRILERAEPTWTERELAGRLARAAYEIGAEPAVALVAGESRGRVPHPIPTDAPLGHRALAVVTTVRHGLHASMSRWVRFGGEDPFADTEAALRDVEADAFAATRAGRRLGDVLADVASAYARHGFGDDAWRAHHQGGPTGYAGRDPKAHPDADEILDAPQAFAWNPWVPGAKLEDTVIACDDGIEVLTRDAAWPTVDVRGLARPVTLVRD
ncbi:M24 family metallopeptidase [Microbacterium karelineae]|uniref:M24 family metallopeptidase n=1 Tax=Microbacterium karelineae TaxID=2654283 RepID=UPI0012EADCD0|nr:M24 family metallopeptidase [Microbacterium karelineae]